MKKYSLIAVLFLISIFPAIGQKPGIGKFYSNEDFDKVFNATLKAVSTITFSVKSIDKANGTILGEMYIISGRGKVLNLFITVKKENSKTNIEATFTKPWGVTGNLEKMAKAFGEEIKKTILDLEIEIEKK